MVIVISDARADGRLEINPRQMMNLTATCRRKGGSPKYSLIVAAGGNIADTK